MPSESGKVRVERSVAGVQVRIENSIDALLIDVSLIDVSLIDVSLIDVSLLCVTFWEEVKYLLLISIDDGRVGKYSFRRVTSSEDGM